MKKIDDCYIIVSDDLALVARGVTRDRQLCHFDEKNKKRILMYHTEGIALNCIFNFPFDNITRKAINHAITMGWITKEESAVGDYSGINSHLIAIPCEVTI